VAEQGRNRADQPLYFPLRRAPVAQGTEHPPSKRQVAGSNPAWGTSTEPPRVCHGLCTCPPLVAFAAFAAFATLHNKQPALEYASPVPNVFCPELPEAPA
jgi:hypothetical protein